MENKMENKKEEYLLKKEEKEKERFFRLRFKKIKKIAFLALPVLFIALGIFIWSNYLSGGNQVSNSGEEKQKITVFYSPTCSCCGEYIPYLKRNGFAVEEKPTRDMLSIKEKYQISSEMESCHTAVIGDYFVEGHMPVEAIKKLLQEQPEIDGIALPGMPGGSPGMGGFKTAPFKIYGISEGQSSEFLSL